MVTAHILTVLTLIHHLLMDVFLHNLGTNIPLSLMLTSNTSLVFEKCADL